MMPPRPALVAATKTPTGDCRRRQGLFF